MGRTRATRGPINKKPVNASDTFSYGNTRGMPIKIVARRRDVKTGYSSI